MKDSWIWSSKEYKEIQKVTDGFPFPQTVIKVFRYLQNEFVK